MLEQATTLDLKRIVELYPLSNIRAAFPALKGTKDEICSIIAEQRDYGSLVNFLDEHFSCCKQHVYIFTREADADGLPATLSNASKIFEVVGEHALYVARVQYSVVLRDPLEETTLDFLWPVRIELIPNHVIVRFFETRPS